jgi:F-type H+-transporting ATPase subunit delta
VAEKMTIARPYAKAVFECATQSKTVTQWAEVLWNLAEISKNEQVLALLREEAISTEAMTDVFLEVCKSDLGEPLRNFILLLAQRKRLILLSEIQQLYKKMQLDSENKVEVNFKSSVSMGETEQKSYQKLLEKYLSRTVTLQCEVDTRLLGGFLASAGNVVIDGSIIGSLTNLKIAMGD